MSGRKDSNGGSRVDAGSGEFLRAVGRRVRSARATRGMTRKILARDSGVSERYLANLEAGTGNVSILLLRGIADAMAMPIGALLGDRAASSPARREIDHLLDRMGEEELRAAAADFRRKVGIAPSEGRARRIGLIGLRGGGKSTLGKALAEDLNVPFIELNRIIEAEYGASLDELFSREGQPAYRRYERRCLERILASYDTVVIATGGGIVANDEAFAALLDGAHTVWVQTSPEEHMDRVVAQGDLRPMADNREAMRDLRQILAAREPAYGRAEATLDTSGRRVAESRRELAALARSLIAGRLAAE